MNSTQCVQFSDGCYEFCKSAAQVCTNGTTVASQYGNYLAFTFSVITCFYVVKGVVKTAVLTKEVSSKIIDSCRKKEEYEFIELESAGIEPEEKIEARRYVYVERATDAAEQFIIAAIPFLFAAAVYYIPMIVEKYGCREMDAYCFDMSVKCDEGCSFLLKAIEKIVKDEIKKIL